MSAQTGIIELEIVERLQDINRKNVEILISSETMKFMNLIDIVIQTSNIIIGAITKNDPRSFLKMYLNAMLIIYLALLSKLGCIVSSELPA